MRLIIAETDKHYGTLLADEFQRRQPEWPIRLCQDSKDLRALLQDQSTYAQSTLFLFQRAAFPALARLPSANAWPESWQVLAMVDQTPGEYGRVVEQSPTIPEARRFAPIDELHRKLQSLVEPPSPNDADPSETDLPVSVPVSDKATQPAVRSVPVQGDADARLWMVVSTVGGGHPSTLSRNRLNWLLGLGRRVVYLPLMPTYLMSFLTTPAHGQNLSDLLLHLSTGSSDTIDLGHYWQPHPSGYLQFRAPERSDDLVLCPADILRALTALLRQRLNGNGGEDDPVTGLIECNGLPLASVTTVAVLCDVCEIGVPKGRDYASEAARLEVGRLLSALPANCRIHEHLV